MWHMTIPVDELDDDDCAAAIGRLSLHHVTTICDGHDVTVEFRGQRIDGVDISGESLAAEAAAILNDLVPFSSDYDPIPTPYTGGDDA